MIVFEFLFEVEFIVCKIYSGDICTTLEIYQIEADQLGIYDYMLQETVREM